MFLDDVSRFAGTGQKNEQGQTLEEFLEAYNPKKYDCPSNTVDIAVFRRQGLHETKSRDHFVQLTGPEVRNTESRNVSNGLQLLMIRRRNHPNIGFWALPGGFVDLKENLEDAAARELQEETGVTGVCLKQHGTWGDYDRDPRWRVITTLYFTILDEDVPVRAGDDAADAGWFDVYFEEIPEISGTQGTPEASGRPETPGTSRAAEAYGTSADGNAGCTRMQLRLENKSAGICLEAEAVCRYSGEGPLRQHHLTMESCSGIAGDHALMIMDVVKYCRAAG